MAQHLFQRKNAIVSIGDLADELQIHYQVFYQKQRTKVPYPMEFVFAILLVLCVWIMIEKESDENYK